MSGENEDKKRSFYEEIQAVRANADKGREPVFLPAQRGRRQVSIKALMERIIGQFLAEYDADALREADTETKRLKLILAAADYVMNVESIIVTQAEKADIIQRVYNELFTYGALDSLFMNPDITTIVLDGADKISVRYGHGDLTPIDPIFDDMEHFTRIINRLLEDSGAVLTPEEPLIETGLIAHRRRISLSIAAPPITFQINVDCRLHPVEPPRLDDLVQAGVMPAFCADILTALVRSSHGVVIVGDTESGKTTLMGVLARMLKGDGMIAVQRAAELDLPEGATSREVRWLQDGTVSFGQQVADAIAELPQVMILDEVRADEAFAIAPLLTASDAPRQLWTFRGPANSKRLTSALGMLARRAAPDAGESAVNALYKRLPFVVTMRRRENALQLYSISEWQFTSGDYPDYVELVSNGELTGKMPTLNLD
ncbi:MAG: hypothetical protein CUN56_08370, partial [Phototrophicales bacterium]